MDGTGDRRFSPKHLRSPTWLLRFQTGNSFECATLLASLLLGQGYNAFVVSGYASREQSRCDYTKRSYPYLLDDNESIDRIERIDVPKYKLKPMQDFRSQFLLEMETREKKKIQDEIKRQEEKRKRKILEMEKPLPDEYEGHRIHAWIVVLPEDGSIRGTEVTEPFFIESSSGMSYNPTDPETNLLYFKVESIWNDQNYWVNMQSSTERCAKINWDLTKTALWEHLLPGEPWTMRDFTKKSAEGDIDIEQEKHLDMPFSYVNEITISSQDFEKRYPNGKKIRFFKKTKVESYAPYVQTDGLVERIIFYNDYEYTTPIRIYEKYSNRADNLVEVNKKLATNHVTEYYKRGRADGCKAHQFYASQSDTIDSERILNFYHTVRIDGLSRIEAHFLYLTQHYIGRDDLLYYRHTKFNPDKATFTQEGIHYRQIWKITEKYHRDENKLAHKDIAIREFAIGEGEIRLKYHYEKDQCTRTMRTFKKPSLTERGERLIFSATMAQGYNSDPFSENDTSLDLFYELNRQLDDEDKCMSYVRDAETELMSFIRIRVNESITSHLTISLFDKNRAAEISKKDDLLRVPSDRDITEVDYLGPYLAHIGHPTHISRAQAFVIQQDCLNDFKKLLVDRANRILHKFEKYQQEFNKLQMMLTQSEDLSQEEEEEILSKSNEIKVYLHTLETRLNRHKDLASERYKMLVESLRQNKRLVLLHK